MRRFESCPDIRSGRQPVIAVFTGLVLAALALAGCSPRRVPQDATTAPLTVPTATVGAESAPTRALGGQFTLLAASNGAVSVPSTGLGDGRVRFYSIESGDKLVPFFVVQDAAGLVHVALDACDVCYESHLGFRQEGDGVVCNACGNRFPLTRINVEQGGCNPVGVGALRQGDQVIIQLADLQAGVRYF